MQKFWLCFFLFFVIGNTIHTYINWREQKHKDELADLKKKIEEMRVPSTITPKELSEEEKEAVLLRYWKNEYVDIIIEIEKQNKNIKGMDPNSPDTISFKKYIDSLESERRYRETMVELYTPNFFDQKK